MRPLSVPTGSSNQPDWNRKAAQAINQLSSSISISGVTADRPSNVEAGFMFFDSTLGLPIWWSGTAWVYCNGEAV